MIKPDPLVIERIFRCHTRVKFLKPKNKPFGDGMYYKLDWDNYRFGKVCTLGATHFFIYINNKAIYQACRVGGGTWEVLRNNLIEDDYEAIDILHDCAVKQYEQDTKEKFTPRPIEEKTK